MAAIKQSAFSSAFTGFALRSMMSSKLSVAMLSTAVSRLCQLRPSRKTKASTAIQRRPARFPLPLRIHTRRKTIRILGNRVSRRAFPHYYLPNIARGPFGRRGTSRSCTLAFPFIGE